MPLPLKSTSLAEIIDPKYYGGNLENELKKARSYSTESGYGTGLDYSKITEKIPLSKTETGEPSYDPRKNVVNLFDKNQLNSAINNWKNMVMANPSEANEWAIANGFESAEDLTRQMTSPEYMQSVLEHEYGHPYTRTEVIGKPGQSSRKLYMDVSQKYMGQPDELINGLARIQREAYSLGGKRFENPVELKNFVESVPYEKAVEGYSDEAKRTWRVLYENRGIERKNKNIPLPLLEWSSKIIPALVQVNKQFEGIS